MSAKQYELLSTLAGFNWVSRATLNNLGLLASANAMIRRGLISVEPLYPGVECFALTEKGRRKLGLAPIE